MMPPSNNMGALNTSAPKVPLSNQVLIDWFSFTLQVLDPREAIKLAGLQAFEFTESKGGGMGYKSSLRSGNIVVFYDGQENMGCHISMTGQGCREFESHHPAAYRWLAFLINLVEQKANFTRLDLAIDNVDGTLNLESIETAINHSEIRSKFKKALIYSEKHLSPSDTRPLGKTIYAGSPSSRLKIRFYDKAAQMGIEEQHWTRAEIQLRAERSQEAIRLLLQGVEAGNLAIKVINNYFQPINNDDVNRSRCSVQCWWLMWSLSTEKIRLTTCKAIKLIEEVVDHIKKQYSASFAMIKKFLGVADFHEFIHELTSLGKEKLTKKHEWIILSSRLITEPFDECSELPF